MFRKLFYLVCTFIVVGLIGPTAAQDVDMEIGFAMQAPVLDGEVDEIWADASTQSFVPLQDPVNGSGTWKALYDAENLYVIVDVTDDSLQNDSASSWQDDSVEIYFDGGNTKLDTPLSGDDHQYTFGWTTDEIQGTNIDGYTEGIEHAQVDTDTGWRIEVKMPWLSIWGVSPQAGDLVGIDCYYNDDDDGGDSREGKMLGFSAVEGWNDASQWATAVLAAMPEPEPVDPGTGNLVHSWTFDDGTADDIVGDANGTLVGDATVVDGQLVLDGDGDWMDMPGDVIAMNTFEGLTIEIQFTSVAGGNTGFHMVTAFGEEGTGDNPGYGYKYICITPARGDNVSRAMIQTVSMDNDPWSEETGVSDVIEHDDGLPHHMVCTVDNTELAFYIEGVLIGTAALDPPGNSVAGIGTDVARIGKGVYGVDPLWAGSVDYLNLYNRALSEAEIRYLAGERAPILVDPNSDLAAAAAMVQPGGTIEFAEGTYFLTSQIEVKDGVTYKGAGPGLTIFDGNDTTRAFVAWGDRSFNEGNGNPNDSGPKGWVIEGITIQNCVADTNNRFSYTGSAFDMNDVFAENDADGSGGLNPEEADADSGGIRLAGPDGQEGTEDDDLHRFVHIDTDGNGELSQEELLAQMAVSEDEFGDQNGDGGAINIDNQAVGTIQNCDFLNNHTPNEGDGDDGGAINIAGLSVVTIIDCWFDGNYACSPTGVQEDGVDGDAGHIKLQGSSASALTPGTTLIAKNCVFLNGRAEDDAGAIQSNGDGSVVRLDSCWFEGNTSWDNGNVCQFQDNEQHEATVTNCVFVNNVTKSDNSPDRMIETKRNSKFVNCTFVGNIQEDQDIIHNRAQAIDTDGDGVDDEFADVAQVINCIFANNVVGNGDDVLGSRNNDFTIAATNCIFFGNTLQNGDAADNSQRTDVETGSILDDPLLDAEYVPGAGSPAIDAGADPATVGIVLVTDYDGVVRPQGAAYDIGAFEVIAETPAE